MSRQRGGRGGGERLVGYSRSSGKGRCPVPEARVGSSAGFEAYVCDSVCATGGKESEDGGLGGRRPMGRRPMAASAGSANQRGRRRPAARDARRAYP